MKRKQLNAIKELAGLRIEDILDGLAVKYSPRYNYYTGPCVVHGGDNANAWSWHVDKQMWRCFSHECERTYGPDIVGFIRGVRECSFIDAVKWLEDFCGGAISPEEVKKLLDQKANREFIEATQQGKHPTKTFPVSCLSRLSHHEYLSGRGFSKETVERYQIGACVQPYRYMSNRLVVPVCNIDGAIVGFTGRTLDEDWERKSIPKWMHSRGNWTSSNLFNINNAAQHIRSTGTVILVEGPFDVLRLEEAGIKNACAILGKTLHEGQMTLLYECGAFTILDALDNDTAGRIGSRTLAKRASCMFDVVKLNIPEGYKDFGEMPPEIIREHFVTLDVEVSA